MYCSLYSANCSDEHELHKHCTAVCTVQSVVVKLNLQEQCTAVCIVHSVLVNLKVQKECTAVSFVQFCCEDEVTQKLYCSLYCP